MPITVLSLLPASELSHGIRGTSDDRQIQYMAKVSAPAAGDFDDEADSAVLDYVETQFPLFWDGMRRGPFGIEQVTPTLFRVTANYSRRDTTDRRSASLRIRYSHSVDTVRTYIALSQLRWGSGSGGSGATDHGNFINVATDDGRLKVEGADVPRPTLELRVETTMTYGTLTPAYRAIVKSLVGKVNNAVFDGSPVGSVLFRGAELGMDYTVAPEESSIEREVAFVFGIKNPPTLPLVIGGITIPAGSDVWGWDLIWPEWNVTEDPTVNDIAAGAKGLYRARVFESGNFGLLALGM